MQTACKNNTKIWGWIAISIATSLFVLLGTLGFSFLNSQIQKVYADTVLINPLENYSTMDTFDTVNGGAYDSSTNPYKINSADDLIKLAYYVNVVRSMDYATSSYELTNHINLSAYNWQPIGALGYDEEEIAYIPFSGIFNGNGYSIYGLTINNTSMSETSTITSAGLFGTVAYTTYNAVNYAPVLKLFGIKDGNIVTNAYYTGAIAGNVVGDLNVIITYPSGASVGDAVSSAVIQECYSASFVQGRVYTGGLVGSISDNACIYNSYSTSSEITGTSGTDVYSTNSAGGAGGIAGIAICEGSTAAIKNCYSVCVVNKEGNTTNVGGIVGNVSSISVARYRTNFYLLLNTSVNDGSTAGTSEPTREVMKDKGIYTDQYWSVKQLESGVIENYIRGDTPNAIWKISDILNNGYPMLTRVNQLSKITLDLTATDLDTPETIAQTYFTGYKDIANPTVSALANAKPIVLNATNFVIEQGKSFYINAEPLETAENHIYEFDDWYYSVRGNTAVDNSINGTAMNTPESSLNTIPYYVGSDMTFKAEFVYKLYTVSFNPNDTNYGSVNVKVSQDGTLGNVDWTGIDFATGNTAEARIGAVVMVQVTPVAGYEVSTWSVNSTTLLDGDENTYVAETYEFAVEGDIIVLVSFTPKEFSFSCTLSSGQTDLGDVTYKIDDSNDISGSTVSSVYFGNVISLYASNIDSNYSIDYWAISVNGGEEVSLGSVSIFTVADYDSPNFTAIAHLKKNYYTVLISINNASVGTVAFVTPSGEGLSRNLAFDDSWSITVQDIQEGYHFEKWDIIYNTDQKDEGADITNVTLSRTGTSYNLYCVAIVSINVYTITLVDTNATEGSLSIGATDYQVSYGTLFQVRATPNAGYYFVNWTDEDNLEMGTNETIKYLVVDDKTFAANFQAINYTVKFFAISSNYDTTYTIGNNCFIQTRSSGYSINENIEFSAVAPMWYEFDYWEMRTTTLTSGTDFVFDNTNGTGVINAIHCNIEIVGYFKLEKATVTFAINDEDFGNYEFIYNDTVLKFNERIQTSYDYSVRSILELRNAIPSEEYYTFSYWLVNGIPVAHSSSLSFEITDNVTVTAVFRYTEYPVNLLLNIDGAGVINGLTSNYYDYNTQFTLNVTTKPGYEFLAWYSLNTVTGVYTKLSEEEILNYTVAGITNIVASFVQKGTVYISLSDKNAGTVVGAGVYNIGTEVQLIALRNEGFKFLHWLKNGEIVSTDSNYDIEVNAGTNKFIAVYIPVKQVSITINNSSLGRIQSSGSTELGSSVTMTATPYNNCTFIGWAVNNNIVSTNSTYNLAVYGDIEVKALFKQNFNWSIVIILVGSILFAIVLILGAINYVKLKESETVRERVLSKFSDGRILLQPDEQRRKRASSKIEPVPTRKIEIKAIEPVPVRKIVVPPMDYKGNVKTKKSLGELTKPDEKLDNKKMRGRPAGAKNKKVKKEKNKSPTGKRGRPKGSTKK